MQTCKHSLTGKVHATTITDNGSNFVKAFAVYSDSFDSVATPQEDPEEEREDDAAFELLTFDFEETNIDDDLTQVQYELPPYYRCAAHTLNLIASKDADKFLSSSSTPKVFTAAYSLKAQLCGTKQADRLWHLILCKKWSTGCVLYLLPQGGTRIMMQ